MFQNAEVDQNFPEKFLSISVFLSIFDPIRLSRFFENVQTKIAKNFSGVDFDLVFHIV